MSVAGRLWIRVRWRRDGSDVKCRVFIGRPRGRLVTHLVPAGTVVLPEVEFVALRERVESWTTQFVEARP